MNKELKALRESIAYDYARLFELEHQFTEAYQLRLSEEQAEEFSGSHRCFSEVAAAIWHDVLRLEKVLVDLPELLDWYLQELKEQERQFFDEIREACDVEYADVGPDRLDDLDRGMKKFQEHKMYWERVQYRARRRQKRRVLGELSWRLPVRSDTGVLLYVELHYSCGARRVIKLAEGTPASPVEDTDVVAF